MNMTRFVMAISMFLVSGNIALTQNVEYVGSYQLTNSFEVVVEWPLAYVCQHFANRE